MKYPEHEKQAKILKESQAIGAFLDNGGLGEGVVLAQWGTGGRSGGNPDVLYPLHKPIQQMLADYFDIDLNKIEREKRKMLAELRAAKIKRQDVSRIH